jgi:hypothetical protein
MDALWWQHNGPSMSVAAAPVGLQRQEGLQNEVEAFHLVQLVELLESETFEGGQGWATDPSHTLLGD